MYTMRTSCFAPLEVYAKCCQVFRGSVLRPNAKQVDRQARIMAQPRAVVLTLTVELWFSFPFNSTKVNTDAIADKT
jgi:hypothetical protein